MHDRRLRRLVKYRSALDSANHLGGFMIRATIFNLGTLQLNCVRDDGAEFVLEDIPPELQTAVDTITQYIDSYLIEAEKLNNQQMTLLQKKRPMRNYWHWQIRSCHGSRILLLRWGRYISLTDCIRSFRRIPLKQTGHLTQRQHYGAR